MQKPITIGITGGIGGGKSTFSSRLRECGQLVFDTDFEAKKLQDEDDSVKTELQELFGKDIYKNDILDRKKIAQIVFSKKEILRKLNHIIHPRVKAKFEEWVQANYTNKYLFMECAILFEGEFDAYVDKILVVTAPEHVRLERVMKRDNQTAQQVHNRMKNQLSEEEKIKRSDWVIETDGLKNTNEKVNGFLKILNL
ncbi:MAG: dephospho-CoA kinase [Paludibacteraceae bacterium]